MLWTRKFIPVPGVSQPPNRPLKPALTEPASICAAKALTSIDCSIEVAAGVEGPPAK